MQGADQLVQIVDRAMAEAVRKSGPWLACRIGCTECCIGPFPITQLDALRLREGLAELEKREPERAARVLGRARASVERIAAEFPQNPIESVLTIDEAAAEEPCPALDPQTGACDLYAARPLTCRTFGPPVRLPGEPSLALCALCFRGASEEEIEACSVEVDFALEEGLLHQLSATTGASGDTIVAFALAKFGADAATPPHSSHHRI
ncbi:MAG TPA: YkgJ family cysteine cluster protein [Bryobacteraceae bacterium]|nr:YkgJ family cysteine cluster protein [Bryobacteraceae bacterium]